MFKLNLALRAAATLLVFLPLSSRAQEAPMANLPPATVGIKALQVNLTGDAEVPGPGAQGGRGTAFVVLNPNAGKVCYSLSVSNMTVPNAAHIHAGAAGVSGNPVVNLNISDRFAGCATNVDSKLIDQIAKNPGEFYVNVHTQEFPAGAIRGQLSD